MSELVYSPVIGLAKTLFIALDLKITQIGEENIPRTGPAVLACNHISYVDFVFCGKSADPLGRKVRFMAKKSSFDHPVSGPLMRGMKHIPVERGNGAAAFEQARRLLEEGEVVGMHPEETISRSYTIKDIRSGAARLAIETGAPLIPVTLFGTQRLYPKGHKVDGRRGVAISITVGAPIPLQRTSDPETATVVLHQRMMDQLETTLDNYAQKPGPGESPWWWPAHRGGSAPTREEMAVLDAADAARRRQKFADGNDTA